jgi:glucose-6-phosphate isomerase
MFAGERINVTEDRAVLHTALRLPRSAALTVDGQDVVADVHEVLDRVYAFADHGALGRLDRRHRQAHRDGRQHRHRRLRPRPGDGYEALAPYRAGRPACRFISNIDPTDAALKTAGLDPETTLFIVASKTFTTLETLTNARLVRAWLLDGLRAAGRHRRSRAREAVAKHFVAVSTALDKVADFGIDPANAFGFWDWVGGRYSVDSAIGTSVLRRRRAGAHSPSCSPASIRSTSTSAPSPVERNVPALMGLLNVWYVNFLDARTTPCSPIRSCCTASRPTCSS